MIQQNIDNVTAFTKVNKFATAKNVLIFSH